MSEPDVINLKALCRPGSAVMPVPRKNNPRLFVPCSNPLDQWKHSSLYPAYRQRAKVYKLLIRTMITLGIAEKVEIPQGRWLLGEFIESVMKKPDCSVVFVGTPSPSQAATVQLWKDGKIVGYLKYASKKATRIRLRREWNVTSKLPKGLGPEPWKYGAFAEGEALLGSPLPGKYRKIYGLPQTGPVRLLNLFPIYDEVPLERHPWIVKRRGNEDWNDDWVQPLLNRDWPVQVQHGDFAPWNLLHAPTGEVTAVDWEYASLEGMPFFDLIHYILQTAALVYRQSPLDSAEKAVRFLTGIRTSKLTHQEAEALVKLTAYNAHRETLENGDHRRSYLQEWRKRIWDHKQHFSTLE